VVLCKFCGQKNTISSRLSKFATCCYEDTFAWTVSNTIVQGTVDGGEGGVAGEDREHLDW